MTGSISKHIKLLISSINYLNFLNLFSTNPIIWFDNFIKDFTLCTIIPYNINIGLFIERGAERMVDNITDKELLHLINQSVKFY